MTTNAFVLRHIGPRPSEQEKMLKTLGVKNLDQLIHETIPDSIRLKKPLSLEPAMSEHEYLLHIHKLSKKNKEHTTYIGLGYHPTVMPAAIQRNILENPGWYTAYTPYQAEIAQGRLEALLNFQTMVCDLTGMPIANASLLDESTAAAEAMSLLYAVRERPQKKAGIRKFFASENLLPQTLDLLQSRATPIGIELVIGTPETFDFSTDFFGALLQYPNTNGQVTDLQPFIEQAKTQHIKVAVAADILSLVKLEAPGKLGADIVIGTTQRLGIPMGYGGPHAAFFATKTAYKRDIPGRIIGITKDSAGNRALRMALQTREQHIKRDRATSNICTAQVLLAVMAGMYAVYHGPDGLRAIADSIHNKTVCLDNALEKMGYKQLNTSYFDTLLIKAKTKKIKRIAKKHKVNLGYLDKHTIRVSINETTSLQDLNELIAVFAQAAHKKPFVVNATPADNRIPKHLQRQSDFLTDSVFNTYHSETALMRYIKKLERRDLSLNHAMIPLGSCTMKLNAATEILPLSWIKWGNIHPFAPASQTRGYTKMLTTLEKQLSTITGFAATSLQPNSGAQGEFAGLMIIKAYHESRGDHHRNVCLIPASAHGTNPASAVMAGMKIVVTKSTAAGNIDVDDLLEKAERHADNLAALMVTYPSTHGVYESTIKDVIDITHRHGGQIYMDGANMNAQVGLTNPATIGADVCHLNLHKTFAIPHGGGGPGVGPICVAKQLVPFLPSNPLVNVGGKKAIRAISGAPYGSALVCLISYGYIKMLGASGLLKATEIAILNANYLKARLAGHYDILFSGECGRVAHEMIVDCRPFKSQGVEVSDIAKRLMDYGFHAPTVSFPVAGTLMIEPTESENKAEIDRFCDAMISIRKEIDAAHKDDTDNPLKNAPHTLSMVTTEQWSKPYTREQAAFPLDYLKENKFWPHVGRVDDAYGDRNLICTCMPVETYTTSS